MNRFFPSHAIVVIWRYLRSIADGVMGEPWPRTSRAPKLPGHQPGSCVQTLGGGYRPGASWGSSAASASAEERIIEIVGVEHMTPIDREEKKVAKEAVRIVHRRHELLLR